MKELSVRNDVSFPHESPRFYKMTWYERRYKMFINYTKLYHFKGAIIFNFIEPNCARRIGHTLTWDTETNVSLAGNATRISSSHLCKWGGIKSMERNSAGSKRGGNVGEEEELKIRCKGERWKWQAREVTKRGRGRILKEWWSLIIIGSGNTKGGEGHKNLREAWKEFINGWRKTRK
jgi:hypothetical protein